MLTVYYSLLLSMSLVQIKVQYRGVHMSALLHYLLQKLLIIIHF